MCTQGLFPGSQGLFYFPKDTRNFLRKTARYLHDEVPPQGDMLFLGFMLDSIVIIDLTAAEFRD
jgi:hypothetical protein